MSATVKPFKNLILACRNSNQKHLTKIACFDITRLVPHCPMLRMKYSDGIDWKEVNSDEFDLAILHGTRLLSKRYGNLAFAIYQGTELIYYQRAISECGGFYDE